MLYDVIILFLAVNKVIDVKYRWIFEISFQGELGATAWVRPYDGETRSRADEVEARRLSSSMGLV